MCRTDRNVSVVVSPCGFNRVKSPAVVQGDTNNNSRAEKHLRLYEGNRYVQTDAKILIFHSKTTSRKKGNTRYKSHHFRAEIETRKIPLNTIISVPVRLLSKLFDGEIFSEEKDTRYSFSAIIGFS